MERMFSINSSGKAFSLTKEEAQQWAKEIISFIGEDFLVNVGVYENIHVNTENEVGDYSLTLGEAEFCLCQEDATFFAFILVQEMEQAGIPFSLSKNHTGYRIPDIEGV